MQKLDPTVTGGMVAFPMERADEVITFYRQFSAEASDKLTCVLILRIAPPAPFIPQEWHGKAIAAIVVCHTGTLEDAERDLKPLKELGPIFDTAVPKPFTVHQAALDGTQPPGRYYYWKSDYLAGCQRRSAGDDPRADGGAALAGVRAHRVPARRRGGTNGRRHVGGRAP